MDAAAVSARQPPSSYRGLVAVFHAVGVDLEVLHVSLVVPRFELERGHPEVPELALWNTRS